jgi:AraC-like DNA-binding protein
MKMPLQIVLPELLRTDALEQPGYPAGFYHDLSFCKGSRIDFEGGTIIKQTVGGSDYNIWLWNFHLANQLECFLEAERGIICLLQCIEGKDEQLIVGTKEMYLLPNMLTLLYLPAGLHVLRVKQGNCFLICIQPPISFLDGMRNDLPEVIVLMDHFLQGKPLCYVLTQLTLARDSWMRLKRIDVPSMQRGIPDLLLRSYLLDALQSFAKAAKQQPEVKLIYLTSKQKAIALKDFLQEHLYDPELPHLPALAKQFYIEVRPLTKAFKQLTGKTIPQFVLEQRMQRALQLTETTMLPVMEIAFRCGFNDVSHFIRSFKKNYGCTPGSLRKK